MDYKALGSRYFSEYLDSKKVRRALIVCVIIGIGTGGFYINQYFKNNRQQEAIFAFNQAMEMYMTAIYTDLDFENSGAKGAWSEVELVFQTAYAQNKNAEFAPFFLMYQAQALAAQQKYQEAADLVGQALDQLSVNLAFYDLYAIMQASLLIDANNAAGVDKLIKIANDNNSGYNDMAQYYLAQYYLANNQIDLAQPILAKLALKDSNWGKLAQAYL